MNQANASAIIVYGANCVWWDSIDKTSNTDRTGRRQGIPICPHCGGVLFQMDNLEKYLAGVPKHEADGHPGYGKMIEWSRGKCFPTMDTMKAAYALETGIIVP